jgi:hypothetical protein
MAEEYNYAKVRKQFGKPPNFEDFPDGIKLVGTVYPDHSKAENFVLRNPNKLVLDNIPQLSHHSVSLTSTSYETVTYPAISLGKHRARRHC